MTPRIKDILLSTDFGSEVMTRGWVRSRRDSKSGFCFLVINDGSCLADLQIIVDESIPGYHESIGGLLTGASVEIRGELVESPAKGQNVEVKATEIHLIGSCPPEYPLQKKRHSFEFLREIAHLRPRSNTFGAISRVRNRLSFAIHEFFQSRGFLYVHTPIVTSSDCEGAGEMFTVTTLDMENPPKDSNGKVDFSHDFFGKRSHLTVSGQLNVETHCLALGNVYTFGPTFRAENSNTSRHLAEFWMIEPEIAFCDLGGDMDLAEEFLRHLLGVLLEDCAADMKFFNDRIDNTVLATLEHIVASNFERLSYTEAIDELLKAKSANFEYPVKWGLDLQSEHERWLTEKVFKKPVILYDYPRDIKAFYMRQNEDEKTVAAMDVLVPKIGEIIGGSQREDRHDVLVARMKELDLNPDDYWWYLDLRRYGSVPHAGFGLGFERLIQFATGMQNIRDVIPFPRVPNNASF
ncbi:MAG: asparagine--tRNA ligase [Candidatus Sumerlaeia bacterium]|nr:asparagine--tRNA ligase [Candidatus Sumerlaeia bacterium]